MKRLKYYFFFLALFYAPATFSQKKISELTIVYNYTLSNTSSTDPTQGSPILNAINTIYIKANMSRSEITSSMFSSATIYDAKSGSAVVLREVSGQKLLIRMTPENWQDKNKRYEGIHFNNVQESKIIAGYKCDKAVATTSDGFTISVYYTKDLVPENKDYDVQFKSLNGLPLEYELTKGSLQIKYVLASINLNPVPASKFDIPKSGYREMSYEESKKLNIEKS